MRDRLGLPIEYDQLHFGFVYTEPVTHFPNIEVSEGEVVALFVAQKALEQYRGTSFEKPSADRFRENHRRAQGSDRVPLGRRGFGHLVPRTRHQRR